VTVAARARVAEQIMRTPAAVEPRQAQPHAEPDGSVGCWPVTGRDGEDGVGDRVRRLRQSRGMSAREVAAAAGVTPAYLSRLENDRVSPTISTLTRVMQAIGEPVGRLFSDDDPVGVPGPAVRKHERRLVSSQGVRDYLVTPLNDPLLKVMDTTIDVGAGSGPRNFSHSGDEECIFVLDGALRIWLGQQRFDLEEGDSLTFACNVGHRWLNPTDQPVRALWIITPGSGY
jgi:transcriptional regulator with XRE-family HTH domain